MRDVATQTIHKLLSIFAQKYTIVTVEGLLSLYLIISECNESLIVTCSIIIVY